MSGKYAIIYGGLPVPAQFTIYKRNYLDGNSLKFVSGIYHEDWEFKPRATYLANSIEWYKPVVYNYLQREVGSITSLFKLKNGFDHIFVMNNLHDFYHTVVKEDECKAGIKRQIGSLMNSVLLGFRSLNEQEKSELLKTLTQQKHLFKDMIESKTKKIRDRRVSTELFTQIGVAYSQNFQITISFIGGIPAKSSRNDFTAI